MDLNKIYLGDCLDLMKDIPDKSIDLVLTDPPYNINIAKWDKIDNYVEWCKQWILECQRVLKDNGSFYFWHNDMAQIKDLMTMIESDTNFIYKQFIVWNKRYKASKNYGFLNGYVEIGGLRNYQKMAEYCLYYTFQDDTGLTKIMGDCVYPVRDYIRGEIIRAKGKIVLKEINQVLGTATNGGGIASACLSEDKTVPAVMTKEHYLKIRDWLNSGKEYEYLRKEYEDLRYTFNNQKTHHSVWEYEIAPKIGHCTPKPVNLIKNILEHSSKEGQTILDPFVGSGTTAIACHDLKRNFICIEKEPKYHEIACKRYEQHKAQLSLF